MGDHKRHDSVIQTQNGPVIAGAPREVPHLAVLGMVMEKDLGWQIESLLNRNPHFESHVEDWTDRNQAVRKLLSNDSVANASEADLQTWWCTKQCRLRLRRK